MKSDTIKLSDKLNLYSKTTTEKDKTIWQLFLSKKEEKTLELEKMIIENHPLISNDFPLYIPSLIDAFKEDNCLYVFIYRDRKLMLSEFEFTNNTEFNKKNQQIIQILEGSIYNFGGYIFEIQKYNIHNKYYFHLHYGRSVGGKSNILLSFVNNKVMLLSFSEQIQKISDEQHLFRELTLEKSKEKIGNEIKKVLTANNLLKQDQKFEYLGFIDDFSSYYSNENNNRRSKGEIYFFYLLNDQTKIIRYNNYDNEWLIGEYKEEEIKTD